MALETLKGLEKVGTVEICRLGKDSATKFPNEFTESSKYFINIDDEQNIISFKIQNGPIKENGVNGCQVVDMIAVARHMIYGLNEKFPCRENAITLTRLDEAILWQAQRTANREARGVEGTSNK